MAALYTCFPERGWELCCTAWDYVDLHCYVSERGACDAKRISNRGAKKVQGRQGRETK